MGRSRRLGFLVLIVALMATACTRTDDEIPRTGRVDVGIVYVGGPAPGASNILRPGTIRVVASDGTVTSKVQVKEGHSDSETLLPGTYRFEAQSGDAQCSTRTVAVRVGPSNPDILIRCSVK